MFEAFDVTVTRELVHAFNNALLRDFLGCVVSSPYVSISEDIPKQRRPLSEPC